MSRIFICAATAGLVACATTLEQRPPSLDDPSNPAAQEALPRAPSATLAVEPPAPSSEAAEPSSKTTFVCPLHSDVTSDHAGRCPKCGMTLVPKTQEAP
jgi:hypothetical protein